MIAKIRFVLSNCVLNTTSKKGHKTKKPISVVAVAEKRHNGDLYTATTLGFLTRVSRSAERLLMTARPKD